MTEQSHRLRPKERIRFRSDGPVWVVVRVNDCAAYVRRELLTPRQVTIPAKVDGEGTVLSPAKTFTVETEGGLLTISPYSVVDRLDVPLAIDPETYGRP